ncbi:HAMP domain-containing sensor histidine kinase [Hymenobacter wooponensis]|uniref:histidine kinase n=1 Tax=Hymenobacter wooponensis TaxID=1525360 RepID=A0A4Z0MCN9_9BACT|nr:ATP-binding protein [Hymenobacter wooponensis]TGD77150.1 HAMP domain-containing protein [Hymenobacter wooponensis]
MTLKNKIRASLIAMLLLLLGLGSYAFLTIQRLEHDAHALQQANLASVEYGVTMLSAVERLEDAPTASALLADFRRALTRETANITEPGELAAVDQLAQHLTDYQRLVDARAPATELAPALRRLRTSTQRIISLNTRSFNTHTQRAAAYARHARRTVLNFIGLSVLVALVLVIRMPKEVLRPLRRLRADVEEVASPGPATQVPITKNDEVGAVALALNRAFGYMQDQRSATRVALATERSRLESLVEHLDEGLLLLDETQCVLLANPTARALLGRSAAELVGHQAEDLSRESDLLRELFRPLLEGQSGDETSQSPVLTFQHNGEEVYYRLSLNHIVSFNSEAGHTEFAGHILSLRNVSDFKKLDQVKSNFLATVSHELKTPLASINLSLMLLQNERTDPEERLRIADGIREETQRLLGMVGQLIDVSRLDAGAGIRLDVQPVTLAQVVAYATDTVQAQLDDKELRLETDLPTGLPAARADVEKTTWVLINLLANAIRYSPRGSAVTVRATQHQEQLEVSVQDYGPGISTEYHERIFQRFAEVPNPAGHKGGSGLGLSISREFISVQGGRLWVESEPGAGSRFLFTLPVAG